MSPKSFDNREGSYVGGNNYGTINVGSTYVQKKKIHSILPFFINALSETTLLMPLKSLDKIPEEYNINDKIPHNGLVKHKDIADSFGEYYSACEVSFLSIDKKHSSSKERILRGMNSLYKTIKKEYVEKYKPDTPIMEIIQKHSDDIVDDFYTILTERLQDNSKIELPAEDIDYCLPIFIGYAFAECSILEKPSK